jgi:hypothetical protein
MRNLQLNKYYIDIILYAIIYKFKNIYIFYLIFKYV